MVRSSWVASVSERIVGHSGGARDGQCDASAAFAVNDVLKLISF